MIIGFNYWGNSIHSNVFDTAIPTSQLDELTIYQGVYDEVFLSVDTKIGKQNEKPTRWQLKHIMDAKFKNDVEAGSLDADGHTITKIQVYRKKMEVGARWILVGETDFDKEYNVYSFVDRTIENDAYYEYAIVPVANKVIGEINTSNPVQASFEGVYVSDLENNYKMEIDFDLGEVSYNKNSSILEPLNGKYPVIVYGNQNYRSGSATFLPLTNEQIVTGGTRINGREEGRLRDTVVNFLNSGSSKIIRNDNGEVLLVAVTNVRSNPKAGSLMDIHNVTFNYTEIGAVEGNTLSKIGLIGQAVKSVYTFDEYGEIVWDI
ncbi:TPA: hypothetical protein ACGO1T_000552 [Streptococcus suis]